MRHLVAALSVIVSAALLASATLDTCALAAPGKSKDPAAQRERELAKLVKKLTKKAQRDSRARSKAFSKRMRSITRAVETGKGLDDLLAEAGVDGLGASVARKDDTGGPPLDPLAYTAIVKFVEGEVVDVLIETHQVFADGSSELRDQVDDGSIFPEEYSLAEYRRMNEFREAMHDSLIDQRRRLLDDLAALEGTFAAAGLDWSPVLGDVPPLAPPTIDPGPFSPATLAFIVAMPDLGVNVGIMPPSPALANQTISVILCDQRGVTLTSAGVVPALTPSGNPFLSTQFRSDQVEPGGQYAVSLLINDGVREWCEGRYFFYVPPVSVDDDPTDPPAHEWPDVDFVELTLGGALEQIEFPHTAQLRAVGSELLDGFFVFDTENEDSRGVAVVNLFDLGLQPAQIQMHDGKWVVCLDQDSGLSPDFHKFDPNAGQALDAGFLIGDYTVKLYFGDDPGKPHPSGFTTRFHMIVEGTLAQMGDTVGSPYKLEMYDSQFTFQILVD